MEAVVVILMFLITPLIVGRFLISQNQKNLPTAFVGTMKLDGKSAPLPRFVVFQIALGVCVNLGG